MSLRKKKITKPESLSAEDVQALSQLESKQLELAMAKIPSEKINDFIRAEESMFKQTGDERIVSGYKKVSDMPIEQGIVIHNPVTGVNEGFLDKEGDLRLMSGHLHPATQAWQKRVGS